MSTWEGRDKHILSAYHPETRQTLAGSSLKPPDSDNGDSIYMFPLFPHFKAFQSFLKIRGTVLSENSREKVPDYQPGFRDEHALCCPQHPALPAEEVSRTPEGEVTGALW